MSARIGILDIETSPILADVWSLRDQNVGLSQIRQDPRMIGLGAKWLGESRVSWWSEYHHDRLTMLERVRDFLDEADIVIHYNGQGFDIPWINGELAREGIGPYSPVKQIDLYRVAKKHFRFPSHKLQYVSTALGLEGKVQHSGHRLWVDCLHGEGEVQRKAWSLMRKYCKQDVALLEPFYYKVRPWITNHPNLSLYDEAIVDENGKALPISECPNCQSEHLQKRGFAVKATRRYRRYQCQGCGGWFTDTVADSEMRIALTGEAR